MTSTQEHDIDVGRLVVVDRSDVKFKPSLSVQLTPDYPDRDTLPANASVYLQQGAYGSQWLRVLTGALDAQPASTQHKAPPASVLGSLWAFFTGAGLPESTAEATPANDCHSSREDGKQHRGQDEALVNELIALVKERLARCKTAFYVGFKQEDANSGLIQALLDSGLQFYHFHEATSEFTYYKWCHPKMPNKVPSYRTSIEGAGIIILSPDGKEVLLTHEYGRWGNPGGAVDIGENAVQAAKREVREEVGLELDDAFPMKAVLFFNQSKSRDGCTNDHFTQFIGKATSKKYTLDLDELHDARWVEVDAFLGMFGTLTIHDSKKGCFIVDGEKYSARTVQGLRNYREERFFVAHEVEVVYPDPQVVFM